MENGGIKGAEKSCLDAEVIFHWLKAKELARQGPLPRTFVRCGAVYSERYAKAFFPHAVRLGSGENFGTHEKKAKIVRAARMR